MFWCSDFDFGIVWFLCFGGLLIALRVGWDNGLVVLCFDVCWWLCCLFLLGCFALCVLLCVWVFVYFSVFVLVWFVCVAVLMFGCFGCFVCFVFASVAFGILV